MREIKRKINKYDLSGATIGVGYANNSLDEFYFDKEDFDIIKNYSWSLNSDGYLVSRINNKIYKMHDLLVDFTGYCDHINRNPLDNRKCNLRNATHKENDRNRRLLNSNTSGVTGVSYIKSRDAWRAYITVDGKRMSLKKSKIFDVAVRARLLAEKQYFKDFAPQKHLFETYGII